MPNRTRSALLALAVAGVLAATLPAYASTPRLTGEVGPGFKIEVTRGEKDVKTLTPGTYTIKVEDKASIHNFHLIGPGVNKRTGVGFVGETTWRVKLRKGTYTYQCDPHAAGGMKGTFRVR